MARSGKSGGLLDVTLVFPAKIELRLNDKKMVRKVGQAVATKVRRRLRAGKGRAGETIPQAKQGDTPPLNKTGSLIRAVKYDGRGQVRAVGKTNRPSGSGGTDDNYKIMAVQVGTRDIDPMGVDTDTEKAKDKAAQKEVDRQFKRGEATLAASLKRM